MILEHVISAAALNVNETFMAEQLPVQGRLRPMRRVSRSEFKSILEDTKHSVAYVRKIGPVRGVKADLKEGCEDGYKRSYGVRVVVLAKRTDGVCENLEASLFAALELVRASLPTLRTAMGADIIDLTSYAIEANTYPTLQSEAPGFDLPLEWAMGYLETNIEITGEAGCFVNC